MTSRSSTQHLVQDLERGCYPNMQRIQDAIKDGALTDNEAAYVIWGGTTPPEFTLRNDNCSFVVMLGTTSPKRRFELFHDMLGQNPNLDQLDIYG